MNNTPNPRKRQLNEVRDIHPLVALWFTKSGYSYTHEYKMPDYGIVDFYATHSDGHTLLVEAKKEKYARVITQLAGYGVQMPEARKAVAIPQESVTGEIQNVASKYNILIIPLVVEIKDNPQTITAKLTKSVSVEVQMALFWRNVIGNEQAVKMLSGFILSETMKAYKPLCVELGEDMAQSLCVLWLSEVNWQGIEVKVDTLQEWLGAHIADEGYDLFI